jgi:hypothetical protein
MIPWLRSLAEKGDKGGVTNVDARSLGRVADELERQCAENAVMREYIHDCGLSDADIKLWTTAFPAQRECDHGLCIDTQDCPQCGRVFAPASTRQVQQNQVWCPHCGKDIADEHAHIYVCCAVEKCI